MPRDHFKFRKENQLNKEDKSIRQEWDEKIVGLCGKINRSENYYTTSSCSGRSVLIIDCKEKRDDLFVKVWHCEISFEGLKGALGEIDSSGLIYFKHEPCILHIAAKSLEDAQKIHDLAKNSGWKRCGIISSSSRFVVELAASEKLEFPIFEGGKCLVSDDFLKVVVREANRKMNISWGLIERFEESIK